VDEGHYRRTAVEDELAYANLAYTLEADVDEPRDLGARLRSGDEPAFRSLVRRLHRSMVGVAIGFVGNRATAEEVVQDTWLAVIQGLEAFEERSSLKNWIFAILANKARSRAVRDSRMITVADFAREVGVDEPAVDPSRFDSSGSWTDRPTAWDEVTPERVVASKQILAHVRDAIDRLPPAQRSVLLLREVENMTPPEVSSLLGITEGNQRVLVHRARSRIREYLEQVLGR
jgi:RNA polymerase sigma-70 factor, ECF subfamily